MKRNEKHTDFRDNLFKKIDSEFEFLLFQALAVRLGRDLLLRPIDQTVAVSTHPPVLALNVSPEGVNSCLSVDALISGRFTVRYTTFYGVGRKFRYQKQGEPGGKFEETATFSESALLLR